MEKVEYLVFSSEVPIIRTTEKKTLESFCYYLDLKGKSYVVEEKIHKMI